MSLLRYVNSTYVPNRSSSTISVKSSSISFENATSMMFKTDNTSVGSSSNTQVKLPLVSNGTYDMTVDWGDGSTSKITTYNQAEVTHTYSSIGTYNVRIAGTCSGWRFNNTGDVLKLLEIKKWGVGFGLGNSSGTFYGCANMVITATEVLDVSTKTAFADMFRGCTALTTVPGMNSWNVSSATSMSAMFYGCTNFNQDISSWNTAKVTIMQEVFYQCTNFNQNISGWNTGAVISFNDMFYQCTSFNQNISSWNTGAATSMTRMFNGATSFNQNIGSWNITNLVTAANMFSGVTLSTANYNALLTGWAAQAVQSSVQFHGGSSKYTAAGQTGRNTLVITYAWSITDGGLE